MSVFTPASQILQRHESLFDDKSLMVSGDFHDDYALQLKTKKTNVHCSLFHLYTQFKGRNKQVNIEFGTQPSLEFYQNGDVLLYYWSKNKVEAQFQLSCLLNNLPKDVNIFIVGENRSGIKSVEKLLPPFGFLQKIDTARRCSLYHFHAENRLAFNLNEWWLGYDLQLDEIDLSICSLPGVFSQKTLDLGSELLLNALLDNRSLIQGNVLDIGCGCGVLSAFAKKINPNISLTSSDVSAVAIESTKRTLQQNQIDANVIASDVFSCINGRFDLILSNPPFHDGKETDYNAVQTLITQSKNYLSHKGKLCIVANSFLPYHDLLAQNFNKVEVIAKTSKFKVYLAE